MHTSYKNDKRLLMSSVSAQNNAIIRNDNGEKKFFYEGFSLVTYNIWLSNFEHVSGFCSYDLYGNWHCYANRTSLAGEVEP